MRKEIANFIIKISDERGKPQIDIPFETVYQHLAEELYEETKRYLTAKIEPVKILSHRAWGVTSNGEEAFEVTIISDVDKTRILKWRKEVEILAERLKGVYKQRKVEIRFCTVDTIFLK